MADTWDRIEDVPEGVTVTDRDGDYWRSSDARTQQGREYLNRYAPFARVEW
jgi:hypothetical protein